MKCRSCGHCDDSHDEIGCLVDGCRCQKQGQAARSQAIEALRLAEIASYKEQVSDEVRRLRSEGRSKEKVDLHRRNDGRGNFKEYQRPETRVHWDERIRNRVVMPFFAACELANQRRIIPDRRPCRRCGKDIIAFLWGAGYWSAYNREGKDIHRIDLCDREAAEPNGWCRRCGIQTPDRICLVCQEEEAAYKLLKPARRKKRKAQ